MGSVYNSSARAFIWLGPGDVDCDRALSVVGTLSNRLDEHRARPDGVDLRDLLQNAVSRSDSEAWAELAALFSRPWFERCWTV